MKLLQIGIVFCCAGGWAQQQPATQNTTAPKTQAQALGVYAYPKNNQDQTQQAKDESECYGSAKSQTGIDPAAPPPPPQQAEQKKGGAVKGAAKGAAGGAAIGAIADDSADKGAAAGAAAGAVRGHRQQKKANKQAQQQAEVNTQTQQAQSLDTFKRAFSACLDARNYSVK
jgi:outer membrane lipoprotein SlyB